MIRSLTDNTSSTSSYWYRLRAAARSPISDLEIEEWVYQLYGFVPHQSWITDCREFYLDQDRHIAFDARHTRPPEK